VDQEEWGKVGLVRASHAVLRLARINAGAFFLGGWGEDVGDPENYAGIWRRTIAASRANFS